MDARVAVEGALAELEALVAGGQQPDRHHARRLLLAHGELLRERPAEAEALAERARQVGARLGEAWLEAVRSELSLACAEHVHSVDARYLGLANYDWDYTLAARERLALRIVAAAALGLPRPDRLLAAVRRADRLLEEHGRGRGT